MRQVKPQTDATLQLALIFDWLFTALAFILLLNQQWTNALLCWAISEIYSMRRRMP